MNDEKIVRMANQIASFFRSYPEDEARKGIHDHLKAFWTPRMREALASYASRDGRNLDPLVVKALQPPEAAKNPIEKEVAGPETVGQMGSDAG